MEIILSNLVKMKLILIEKKLFIFSSLLFLESAFLIYFSFLPSYDIPTIHIPFLRPGDFEHFIAYLIYGILLFGTLKFNGLNKYEFLTAMIIVSFFAGLTEVIQFFVPTRFLDPIDWLIDIFGSSTGIYVFNKNFTFS